MTIRRTSRIIALAIAIVATASSTTLYLGMHSTSLRVRELDMVDDVVKCLYNLKILAVEDSNSRATPGERTAQWNAVRNDLVATLDSTVTLLREEPDEVASIRGNIRDIDLLLARQPDRRSATGQGGPAEGLEPLHDAQISDMLDASILDVTHWYNRTERVILERVRQLQLVAALVAAVASLIALAMVLTVDRRLLRPAFEIERTANRMAAGDARARVVNLSADELGNAGRAFNAMAAALEDERYRLLHSERRLREAQALARVGSFERNLDTGDGYWSDELYRILGYRAGEVEHSHELFIDHVHEDDRARVREAIADAGRSQGAFEFDTRLVRRDGGIRHAFASGRYVDTAGGGLIRGALLDITERKLAENEIREARDQLAARERQYRALVDNALDVIWTTGIDLVFRYVSPSITKMMGYSPEEMVGTHVQDYCDGPTFARIAEVLALQLEQGPDRDGVVVEVPLRHKDGHELMVEVRASALTDADGVPTHIQGVSRDITERRRMQLERERLLRAIEHVAEGVMITDCDGTIEYVNPEFERMTGYTATEAIGANPRILKSGEHDAEHYDTFWRAIRSGRTWQGRFTNRRKDGTLYVEEDTVSSVHDASGEITNYVAVKRDITDDLAMEDQLRQAQKMEAVGQLAGGVAHDFNNMLGVILGYAQLALDRLPPGDPLRPALDEIVKAGERSSNLTRQLLGFARKQPASPQVLDLNAAVEGTLQMLDRMIGEHIELMWVPGSDVAPAEIDPSQLDQILANLVVNARDAIPDVGRVVIKTERVQLDEAYCRSHVGFSPGDYTQLSVTDNGTGMDKDTLTHVFEPFFTTKDSSGGTGLGLATIYGIVKQNEGFINIYSEPGIGTTVTIYLPAQTGTAVVPPRAVERTETRKGTETVLVVEDEPALLELATASLEGLGYEVLPANSPGRALEIARECRQPIHLLMTDVVMPEMNGQELWDRLLETNPSLLCLFVSGYPMDVVREHGRLDDGVAFLQKPFVLDALSAKVREVLDGRTEDHAG